MPVKMLVVDDDRNMLSLVDRTLKIQGITPMLAADGETAINMLKEHKFDIVLLDLRLPVLPGEEIFKIIKIRYPATDVIIMTAYATVESAIQTLKKGAYDYLVKPTTIDNIWLTIKRCIEKRELFEQLSTEKKMFSKISELYDRLDDLFIGTVESLGDVIEAKDVYTGGHCERMNRYSSIISEKIGLPESARSSLRYAALLHDIGKIAVPEAILLKPEKLTDNEFDIMKKHTIRGVEILSPIKQLSDSLPGIKYHHEKYDGTGYPEGLNGQNIPLIGRIISVADSFDAMTSDRPYRKKLSFDDAKSELIRCSGTQFDPELVNVFVEYFNLTI